jgi:hypothetical protein
VKSLSNATVLSALHLSLPYISALYHLIYIDMGTGRSRNQKAALQQLNRRFRDFETSSESQVSVDLPPTIKSANNNPTTPLKRAHEDDELDHLHKQWRSKKSKRLRRDTNIAQLEHQSQELQCSSSSATAAYIELKKSYMMLLQRIHHVHTQSIAADSQVLSMHAQLDIAGDTLKQAQHVLVLAEARERSQTERIRGLTRTIRMHEARARRATAKSSITAHSLSATMHPKEKGVVNDG